MQELKLILPFEVKSINTNDSKYYVVSGYASTFGNIDRGGDIIIRGAFADALNENDSFPLLWQHNTSEPIGAWTGYEDEKGLFIEAKLPKGDSLVEDRVMKQLEIGSIKAFSIGYSTEQAEFTDEGNRVLKKVRLWETSLVTIPMNPEAIVTGFKNFVSSIEENENEDDKEKKEKNIEDIESLKDIESFFKSKGMSKSESRAIIFKVSSIKNKDVDDDDEEQKRCDAVEQKKRCDAVQLKYAEDCVKSINNFINEFKR